MATLISRDFCDSFDGNYGYQLEDLTSYKLVDMIKNFMANKESNGTMDYDSYYDMATIGFQMAYLALSKATGAPMDVKDFMEGAKEFMII